MEILKQYFWKQKGRISLIILLKMLASCAALLIPWAFAYTTENIIPLNSSVEVIKWGGLMILFAIGNLGLNLSSFKVNAQFTAKLAKSIRKDLFIKANSLDCDKVDSIGVSSLTARLTTDVSSVQMFSGKLMTKGVATITTLVGSVITASVLDFKLAFVIFAIIPLIIATIYFTTTIGIKRFLLTKKVNDKLVKSIRENVLGIRVIKSLSKFEYENKKFEEVSDELRNKNYNASIVDAIGSPTMKLIVNVGMVGTLFLGAYYIKAGTSSIPALIAFMSYFTMILNSLVGIGHLFTMYSRAGAAANRIQEVLDLEPKQYKPVVEKENQSDEYMVEFKNVSFSYIKGQKVLEDISFKIKKGETLGIIGVTGSGKTSIINLILRLYEPDSGQILILGKPIQNYDAKKLYEMFGVVFQDDVIFKETVANNISFGRNVAREKIEEAANASQAQNFISNLKDKYDAMINIRGKNISGGEKQRLLIARALANSPKILILDDSTSALDYKTDASLRKHLSGDFKDSTKILVSSRVASIINAGQIIVLEDGKITGLGNHDSLVKDCEIYKEICDLQLGDTAKYNV